MQIVLRFVKQGSDSREKTRTQVIQFRKFGTPHFNWNEAVAAAVFHAREGERIVMIAEAGYH